MGHPPCLPPTLSHRSRDKGGASPGTRSERVGQPPTQGCCAAPIWGDVSTTPAHAQAWLSSLAVPRMPMDAPDAASRPEERPAA